MSRLSGLLDEIEKAPTSRLADLLEPNVTVVPQAGYLGGPGLETLGISDEPGPETRPGKIPMPDFGLTEAWKRGKERRDFYDLASRAWLGEISDEDVAKAEKALTPAPKERNLGKRILQQTVEILPPMVQGTVEGGRLAGYGGAVGAGMGAVAGGTVGSAPGAAAGALPGAAVGVSAGFGIGSMGYWARQGAGEVYWEARKAGVSPGKARVAASIAGPLYAAVEYSQMEKLVPGAKMARRSLLRAGLRLAGRVAHESSEEAIQKIITEGAVTGAKIADKAIDASDLPAEGKRIVKESFREFVQTLGPMSLLGLPGTAIEYAGAPAAQQPRVGPTVEAAQKQAESSRLADLAHAAEQEPAGARGATDVAQPKPDINEAMLQTQAAREAAGETPVARIRPPTQGKSLAEITTEDAVRPSQPAQEARTPVEPTQTTPPAEIVAPEPESPALERPVAQPQARPPAETVRAAEEQVPAQPQAKQPWEMTDEEFGNASRADRRRDVESKRTPEIERYMKVRRISPDHWLSFSLDDAHHGTPAAKKAANDALASVGIKHKSSTGTYKGGVWVDEREYVVADALAEGKPVPRAVLEEYKGQKWADEALAKMGATTAQQPALPPRKGGVVGFPAQTAGTLVRPADLPLEKERKTRRSIPAHKIMKALSEAFNVPIRGMATHRPGKRAGFYDIKARGIRLVDVNALDVAAHEVGHHVDHYHKIRKRTQRGYTVPPGTKAELVALGKTLYGDRKPPGGYASEGVAEFVRRYMTNDPAAEKDAPNFHKWFTTQYLKDNPRIAKLVAMAQDMYRVYTEQGAEARIAGSRLKGDIKTSWLTSVRKFLLGADTDWRDEFAPLRVGLEKAGLKGKLQPVDDPAFLAAVFADKASAKAQYWALEGMTDYAGNVVGPSLQKVFEPVAGNIEQFLNWAESAKALQLWGLELNPGIERADAQYVYDKFDSPTYQKVLKEWTEWSRGGLNYLVEVGAMDAATRDRIIKKHPIYIPFMRSFEKGEVRRRGAGGKGMLAKGGIIQRIKGSGRPRLDPIMASLTNAEKLISAAHKVAVSRALAKVATQEGIGELIWRVPAPIEARTLTADKIKKDVIRLAQDHLGLEIDDPGVFSESWDEMLTIFLEGRDYRGKDNIISMVIDGKRRFYEVNPDLYAVLEGLDQYKLPWYLDLVLGKTTRMIRLGVTGLNPAFSLIRNIIRDAVTFTVLSKHAKAGPISVAGGQMRTIADKASKFVSHFGIDLKLSLRDVELFEALGGDMSVQILHDRRGQKHLRSKVLASSGTRYTIHTFKHPIEALKELFGTPEAGTRIAEMGATLKWAEKKYGKGTANATFTALYAAQDVTTNFTRHGRQGKKLNQAVLFFNAGIQGPDKILRTVRERPLRVFLTGIAALTLPAIWLWWRHRDEEWYKEMSDYEKYNYLHWQKDDNTIIRWPVAFELGHFFQSLPVAGLDAMYRKNPEEVARAIMEMADKANPLSLPAAIVPVSEVWRNENFAGVPIVPRSVEGKLPADQYKPHTTTLMRLLGKQLGYSPAKLEHLVSGYTGGAYDRVARALDNFDDDQEHTLSDLPVLGTLFLRESYAPRQSIERFYRRAEYLDGAFQSKNITPDELVERRRYIQATRKLSPLWKKMRETTTEDQRKDLYSAIGGIIKVAETEWTITELNREIIKNSYADMPGVPHKGQEDYIKALMAAKRRKQSKE